MLYHRPVTVESAATLYPLLTQYLVYNLVEITLWLVSIYYKVDFVCHVNLFTCAKMCACTHVRMSTSVHVHVKFKTSLKNTSVRSHLYKHGQMFLKLLTANKFHTRKMITWVRYILLMANPFNDLKGLYGVCFFNTNKSKTTPIVSWCFWTSILHPLFWFINHPFFWLFF